MHSPTEKMEKDTNSPAGSGDPQQLSSSRRPSDVTSDTPGNQASEPDSQPSILHRYLYDNWRTTGSAASGRSSGRGRSPACGASSVLNMSSWRRNDDSSLAQTQRTSPNYQGNANDPANQSAGIPEEQSCAVYITNLPPTCDVKMLLSAVRSVGKVFASNVIAPDDVHDTAAAKIVFWDRQATDRFIEQYDRGTWQVGGFLPNVVLNRIRVASQEPAQSSRVVQIHGPPAVVNEQFLKAFLDKHCRYELEEVREIIRTDRSVRLEFRFSSYRCQAATAYMVWCKARAGDANVAGQFAEDEKALWAEVRVYWGPDPCAQA